MTPLEILALLLYILGVLGLFAQAFGATLGRVAPGWLGAGLFALAYLLTSYPG